MEILLQTKPQLNKENGLILKCIEHNGENIELRKLSPFNVIKSYRLITNNPFLVRELNLVGDCNILTMNENTEQELYRLILEYEVTGCWYLITEEELNRLFIEVD
jgi:type II secretory pathway component GspD/PulD (secretin)